jgi:hypothetical protein
MLCQNWGAEFRFSDISRVTSAFINESLRNAQITASDFLERLREFSLEGT